MGTPETSREPILDDVGGAFGMGAVGGAAFHFLKGTYNSPKGERLAGGSQAVRMNAPRVGGSFAVRGGLFSTFDCTMVYMRQKEDPWNSIIAAGIMLNKVMSAPQNLPPMEEPVPNVAGYPGQMPGRPSASVGGLGEGSSSSPSSPSSSSWLGSLFGKKEETAPSDGSKTKVLESFDSPTPPSFRVQMMKKGNLAKEILYMLLTTKITHLFSLALLEMVYSYNYKN
ncbi:hypothetical protein SASPL_148979 [Salvia splendens]|uniref:Mitochondrial import inner membrane translocase subunit TIM22 n=1 Tax=Salvia splendens TaxID=180675 RepID=A0A8X8Z488_SALSN|nr:hypothetical protein SASPL_148979 [Salvia splendens]